MGIPSKTCSLKQVNSLIGPQVKTLVDSEILSSRTRLPCQQIASGRLSTLNPGPAGASGGKLSQESRGSTQVYF